MKAPQLGGGKAAARRVVGVGAGGHARVVLDILRLAGGYEVIGLVDVDERRWGGEMDGVAVLGDDARLPELYRSGVAYAFNGIGSSADAGPRKRAFEMIVGLGFQMVQVIHPTAVVSSFASIRVGATIMANAVVNPGARLGANVIVNSGAIVEHDCVIGDHTHVSTGSRVGGDVHVGDECHIGIGASIRQGITIGRGSVVGAGAAVVTDVPDFVVVAGVPAKVLRAVEL